MYLAHLGAKSWRNREQGQFSENSPDKSRHREHNEIQAYSALSAQIFRNRVKNWQIQRKLEIVDKLMVFVRFHHVLHILNDLPLFFAIWARKEATSTPMRLLLSRSYRGTIEGYRGTIGRQFGHYSRTIWRRLGDHTGTIGGPIPWGFEDSPLVDPWWSPAFPLYFPDRRLGVLRQSPDRVKSPLSLRVKASKPNRCCVQQQWVHSHGKISFDWANLGCNIYRISRRS